MRNHKKIILPAILIGLVIVGFLFGFLIVRKSQKAQDAAAPSEIALDEDHNSEEKAADSDDKNSDEEKTNSDSNPNQQNSNEDDDKQGDTKQEDEGKNIDDSDQKTTASDQTPFEQHGKLSLDGVLLVDSNQETFQLKGVSTHGLAWFPAYANKASYQTLRDEWGVNTIRLAMYTAEYNGYCTGDENNRKNLKKIINDSVDACSELGLYVIIDWHVLQDKDPNVYLEEAKTFFAEMSELYADNDHVIYEICNEPNGDQVKWATVKSYAEEVIPVIKKNNEDAIIIVGTPTWSQDADLAAKDPIKDYTNIMYAVHFYAATHKEGIQNKMMAAYNAGLPVIVSEFGICDSSGNGAYDEQSADQWFDLMTENHIGYVIWNLSNKNETSALISAGCSKTSGWTKDDLTGEALWFIDRLGGKVKAGSNQNESGNEDANTGKAGGISSGENGDVKASVVMSNSWGDSGNYNYQYDLTVSNQGDAKISGWKVILSFASDVTVAQSWNCNVSADGSQLTITPVEYNGSVDASGSIKDIGMILSSSSEAGKPEVTVE